MHATNALQEYHFHICWLDKISFVFEMYVKGTIFSSKAMSLQRLGRKGKSKVTAACGVQ
jgi:hypothetical protein